MLKPYICYGRSDAGISNTNKLQRIECFSLKNDERAAAPGLPAEGSLRELAAALAGRPDSRGTPLFMRTSPLALATPTYQSRVLLDSEVLWHAMPPPGWMGHEQDPYARLARRWGARLWATVRVLLLGLSAPESGLSLLNLDVMRRVRGLQCPPSGGPVGSGSGPLPPSVVPSE